MTTSKIVICDNLEYGQESIISAIDSKLIKKFFDDDFKVDMAHSVIKEAYIAESEPKYIIVSAQSFNLYAQNTLLKMFEEPPRNIIFILITKNKSALLPTIRSRMQVEILKVQKSPFEIGLDIKRAGLKEIFEFLKSHSYTTKDDLKRLIEAIVKDALLRVKIDFSESGLDMIDRLFHLANLNSKSQNILSYLLIMIYTKRQNEYKKIK